MRIFAMLLLIVALLPFNFAFAGKDIPANLDLGPTINMSEPPFWMPSYDEFEDLQASQKEFYLEKFLTQTSAVPSLQGLTKAQLLEASEWAQGWTNIAKKLYGYCLDKSVVKTCQDFAATRLEAFDIFANQKQENRDADEEDAAAREAASTIPEALKAQ